MRSGTLRFVGAGAWLAAMLVIGCGGGAAGGGTSGGATGSGTATGGGGTSGVSNNELLTGQQNDAVFTYSGQPPLQITSSKGNVTVQGQAGATFYSVNVGPAPAIGGSYLVVDRQYAGTAGGELDRLTYPSGTSQQIYKGSSYLGGVAASPTGELAFNDQALPNALRTIKIDGTGLGSIAFNLKDPPYSASYAPDTSGRIAFIAGEEMCIGPNTDGAGTASFSPNTWGSPAAWSTSGPYSRKIMFAAISGLDFKPVDLFEADSIGGPYPTIVSPTALKGQGTFASVAWSPDGDTIAATYIPAGAKSSEIVVFPIAAGGSIYKVITAEGDGDSSPVFSPDGSKLAFYHSSASGQPPGIYVSDPSGQNRTLLCADTSGNINSFTWVPALNQTVSVGPTSEFESGPLSYLPGPVAGFLLSRNGTQFGSFFTFTATDNATAAIRTSASAPLTFILTAKWISSVTYTNVNSSSTTGTLIDLYQPASVMVSIDGTTGQVETVSPSSVADPAEIKNSDGTVSYKGPFTAVYDAHGKNLAPAGASTLAINPKTGKLVRMGS